MKDQKKLIGRKVKGFEYKTVQFDEIIKYVGQIGTIDTYSKNNNMFIVKFEHAFVYYPADQIEAHLVEDEIPTLSYGVMMLVSVDENNWYERKVVLKSNEGFYVKGLITSSLVFWKYAKPLEPTKEEQLTAILGNSDKVSEIMELFKN